VPQRRHGSGIVPIEEALEEIRAGRMIILMDDEDRENEGDVCVAAERVSPEHINIMARGRGSSACRSPSTSASSSACP
jgi:3,4-dihydroxy-2-butanone 4-phosphate synthase